MGNGCGRWRQRASKVTDREHQSEVLSVKDSWLHFSAASKEQEKILGTLVGSLKQAAKGLDGRFFRLLASELFEHRAISNSHDLKEWVDSSQTGCIGVCERADSVLDLHPAVVAVDCEWGKIDQVVSTVQKLDENQLNSITSVQISAGTKVCFVDMFEMADKQNAICQLKRILEQPQIIKVFHGCASDLLLLYRSFSIIPVNIFDSAAASCTLTASTSEPSLAKLVHEYLGLKMDKAYQKSNWKIRPLPQPMLEYALADAALLLPVYFELKRELENFESEELSQSAALEKVWIRSGNHDRKTNKTDWKFVFSD